MIEVLTYTLLGSLIYRMRGGGQPDLTKVVDLAIWAILFTSVALGVYGLSWVLLPVLVGTYVLTTPGHGSYMDLTRTGQRDNEVFKPLLDWMFGPGDGLDYDREAFGLALTGVLPMIPLAIAVGIQHPLVGLGLAAAGALKWPAYELGWRLDEVFGDAANAHRHGERLFGAAAGLALGLASLFVG